MYRLVPAILLMLLFDACSPVTILNAMAPRAGVTAYRDIAYGEGPDHRLDLYAPSEPGAGAPIVVFFYGGGWDSGDRGMYRFIGATLAERGMVAVIPSYRIYPAGRFPDFMHDGAAAVAWARAQGGRYGGDADRLFLMGHSAGAQIAALLALDTTYLAAEEIDPCAVRGVVGLAGPYDFLPLRSARLQAIFGPQSDWPRSQPINYVTSAAPPMLLAAGSNDSTVDPGNTARLAARLRAAGVEVEEHLYRGVGHKALVGAFSSPLAFLAPVRRDALDFIARHGTGTRCAPKAALPAFQALGQSLPAREP